MKKPTTWKLVMIQRLYFNVAGLLGIKLDRQKNNPPEY